ncbi:PadR family transcriptional regulator [Gemella cuniculi]|uniref:PadR family transcriptional regulator n=1 Tax=Gemella cuniculi TaxID=150240 RepID=UPI0004186E4B|nr:PadR family transcriptional regulator [Gemella cuniculi]
MAKASPYETGELTDSIFFTLLVLTKPVHGYMIMQKVSEITNGFVIIGPATMYTTLGKMVGVGWIEERNVDSSKKEYHTTPKGLEILRKNFQQRKFLLNAANDFLREEL